MCQDSKRTCKAVVLLAVWCRSRSHNSTHAQFLTRSSTCFVYLWAPTWNQVIRVFRNHERIMYNVPRIKLVSYSHWTTGVRAEEKNSQTLPACLCRQQVGGVSRASPTYNHWLHILICWTKRTSCTLQLVLILLQMTLCREGQVISESLRSTKNLISFPFAVFWSSLSYRISGFYGRN